LGERVDILTVSYKLLVLLVGLQTFVIKWKLFVGQSFAGTSHNQSHDGRFDVSCLFFISVCSKHTSATCANYSLCSHWNMAEYSPEKSRLYIWLTWRAGVKGQAY